MISACKTAFCVINPLRYICILQAKIYYAAVDLIGVFSYESAQNDFCLWEPCCEEI